MSTEAQRLITVTVLGHPRLGALGPFEVKSGGGGGSESTTFTPGGQPEPKVIGGRKTYEDVTVNRVFLHPRDDDLIGDLLAARGDYRVAVADQPLDSHYNPVGTPVVWNGVLGDVQYPDSDSESNNAARLVLIIHPDGIKA